MALLLLTLEFMAPAFLVAEFSEFQEKAQIVNTSPFQNPLFSFCIEELCENEEGKDETRTFLMAGDFMLPTNKLWQPEQADPASFIASLRQFETHPPLFRLLRKLVI